MRSRKRSRDSEVELNITAFLNLMVVLIPFLLLNAVFAQVSVLQLNLPSSEAAPPSDAEDKKPVTLEVLIYKNRYEVVDRKSNRVLNVINNLDADTHDAENLRSYLRSVKEKYPAITDITLLCEDGTPYKLMIQTMDTVRYYRELVNGTMIKRELFPDIGIGDAPPDTSAQAGGA